MFFSAFLEKKENVDFWKNLMHQHSAWLDMTPYLESRKLEDSRVFCFGWLKSKISVNNANVVENDKYIIMTTTGEPMNVKNEELTKENWQHLFSDASKNIIQIGLAKKSGEINVIVPPTTPEQFYFSSDSRGYLLSNDLRMMLRWVDMELDEHAAYSLFQYGSIPAPLTINKNVKQVPKGHTLKIYPEINKHEFKPFFHLNNKVQIIEEKLSHEENIKNSLRNILQKVQDSSLLHFSGGVDSALLASLLAELNRTNIRLINFSFGPHDEEAQLALRIAEHLGLECKQVIYNQQDIVDMFEHIGKDYSYPFGDYSAIVTNLMVNKSLEEFSEVKTTINGIAADGAFAIGMKYPLWNRIYSVPNFIRQIISKSYTMLNLWKYDFKVEYLGRIFRRSCQMPINLAAVIAQNSLDGIAYSIPREIREEIEEVIRTRVQFFTETLNPKDQFSLLDLMHVCAGEFAPKSFDPLRRNGVKAIYPFLEPAMVKLSFSIPWEIKCKNGEQKAILKKILSKYIPSDWVYRPKSPFTPPIREILSYPQVQEYIQNIVISKENPLTRYCNMNLVKKMFERAKEGKPLSNGAYNFLWVLMFTSGWLNQLKYFRMK